MEPDYLKYGIIGAGNIGQILIRKLAAKGKLLWVVESDSNKINNIKETISFKFELFSDISEIHIIPHIIIIAVNDTSIENVAEKLSDILDKRLEGVYVFHLSGSLPLKLLSSCKDKGADIFTMHPYQTFYGDDSTALDNAIWAVEKGDVDLNIINNIVSDLGGDYEIFTPETLKNKNLYHLSAVLASNYLILSLSFAKRIAEISGINPAKFLPPILKQTINNFINYGLNNKLPLTGPIARGDFEIIRKHISALENKPELLEIYANMTKSALKILKLENMINEQEYKSMLNYLEQFNGDKECK